MSKRESGSEGRAYCSQKQQKQRTDICRIGRPSFARSRWAEREKDWTEEASSSTSSAGIFVGVWRAWSSEAGGSDRHNFGSAATRIGLLTEHQTPPTDHWISTASRNFLNELDQIPKSLKHPHALFIPSVDSVIHERSEILVFLNPLPIFASNLTVHLPHLVIQMGKVGESFID
jgi:hypothetical protein